MAKRPSGHKNSSDEFSSIFNQYYASLVLYAYRLTDNQSAAEDIAEDAFVNLWKKGNSLNQIQSIKAYLYTIARNGCLLWMKQNKREITRNKVAAVLDGSFQRTALENMIFSETMAHIYMAIDKLPNQCRKVFVLHFIEGKKLSEIAEELKISVGTAKTHKIRGIGILRKALLTILYWAILTY